MAWTLLTRPRRTHPVGRADTSYCRPAPTADWGTAAWL